MTSITEYVLKFIVGGAIISFISYLGKKGDTLLAGIFAIAPIITLISFIVVGNESGNKILKDVVGNAIIFLPLTFIYLIVLFLLLRKTSINVNISILLSFLSWFICAVVFLRYKS